MEEIKIYDQMVLDQYRIIEKLDVNSNNNLYKAQKEDDTTEKFYIIKAVPYQTEDEIENVQNEASILELFKNSPLFIAYEDHFEQIIDAEYYDDEGQLIQYKKNYMFIVMKYYKNKDLTLYNFRFSEKIILHIMYQALTALLELKNKEIVHNDIKLGNFLVVSLDPVKIILTDFEFAEKLSANEKTFSNNGTSVFMAPEVLNDEEHDHSVDIWALGVSGYRLAGGCYPFKLINKDDIKITREKVKRNKLNFPRIDFKDKSNDLKNLLSKMLEKDPSKRITVEQALSDKLFDEFKLNSDEVNVNDEESFLESSLCRN